MLDGTESSADATRLPDADRSCKFFEGKFCETLILLLFLVGEQEVRFVAEASK